MAGPVAIVGASLAGVRAAEALRESGHEGPIVLIGTEPQRPYDRPPLSKAFLAGHGDDDIALVSETELEHLDLDLRLGRTATGLDPARRRIALDDGSQVGYESAVIATGSEPLVPSGWCDLEGACTLRTVDDAMGLRHGLGRNDGPLVIVGAGFIGCEVASTARAMGIPVTIVEQASAPMIRALGQEVGSAFMQYHREAGVDLRCGVGVGAIEGEGRVGSVVLTDGSVVQAAAVLVGIGARPATDWLRGSGVGIADGVLCNETLETALPGVYAAGDVARWQSPFHPDPIRVEHWTNASSQGAYVGRAIAAGGAEHPFEAVPFVWSEQLGARIEIAGMPDGGKAHLVEGSFAERRFVALFERAGMLAAAVAVDSPRGLLRFRRLLAERATWQEAMEVAEIQRTHSAARRPLESVSVGKNMLPPGTG